MTAALEVQRLHAGYGRTEVLRGVDLSIDVGSVVAILGPNGAGKSTLLRTISGLIAPTDGSITLFGDDATRESPARRVTRGLCHIPEGRGIFRSLTVQENIELLAPRGSTAETLDAVVQAFPILGQRLGQMAGTLSGGQQQMLAVSRAYIQNSKLVLVDEASLGLAPVIVDAIFEFFTSITDQGASLVIVDQFVTRALQMSSHAYVLNRGVIRFDGPSAELRDVDVFEQYLGDTPPAHEDGHAETTS